MSSRSFTSLWNDYVADFVRFALVIFAFAVSIRVFIHCIVGELPLYLVGYPLLVALLVLLILLKYTPRSLEKEFKSRFFFTNDQPFLAPLFSFPYIYFWITFSFCIFIESYIFSQYRSLLRELLVISKDYYGSVSEVFLIPLLLTLITVGIVGFYFLGVKYKLTPLTLFTLFFIPIVVGCIILAIFDWYPMIKEQYIESIASMIGLVTLGWGYELASVFYKILSSQRE